MNKPEEIDINNEVADLAEAILKVSQLGEQLKNGKLRRRAVVLLVNDLTDVNFGDINKVLDALPRLKGYINE